MIKEQNLKELLGDLESDRVERTTSTTDTDKFCEAICAFANDLPANNLPGYLIIGARDSDGAVVGVNVTDRLLQQLSNYADSGQIVPLPSITVQKISFPEGDVAVVEVRPSDILPVRYRGRVWIRRGTRRGIANEHEERILTEKRTHHAFVRHETLQGMWPRRACTGSIPTHLPECRDCSGNPQGERQGHASPPESVSPLKEENRVPYPMLAVRELLMNAVMHRDYESNAAIRLYWFSDRIEIQNAADSTGL